MSEKNRNALTTIPENISAIDPVVRIAPLTHSVPQCANAKYVVSLDTIPPVTLPMR